MGRRKIEIKAIKDDRNRSVTFLKRKGGLFKKAHELAVLCSVDVAVIIFGHNKKLYEFSSCDMPETLGKYQYFGPPHEHKGPEDFAGKRDADDDDEDETTPAPDDIPSRSRTHSVVPHPPPPAPPSIQNQPGFQHINQAPSASPPIPTNGLAFAPLPPPSHRSTPQPRVLSRPTSRNHIRRVSSNLVPQQHRATPPPPHPHPHQNGFAYMPNPPPIYNTNPAAAAAALNHQQHHHHHHNPPRPVQYPHFTHPAPQLQPAPPHLQSPHPQPMHHHHSPMPPQSIPPRHHQTTPHAPPSHSLPQIGLSSQPHPPMPQMAQVYLPEQARSPMPPAFSEPPQPRSVPLPDTSPTDQTPVPAKSDESQSSKSRSIFTPIDDRGSVLARHFGVGPPVSEYPRTTPMVKSESAAAQSESNETAKLSSLSSSSGLPGVLPTAPAVPPPTRAKTIPAVPELKPPVRTNSGSISARPKLTVQIPSENSDRGSTTAESSTRDSAGNENQTPVKANQENSHPGVVLPPPSPSAGAILSAGAQGPPNPFARPPPPATTAAAQNNNSNSNNNNNNNNNNNIETPISALPSRFVSDALLPSPSSFFPEWGFGRTGPDSNMLPSPLTFPTPSGATGPSFSREDENERKRKNEDTSSNSNSNSNSQEAASKRVKT